MSAQDSSGSSSPNPSLWAASPWAASPYLALARGAVQGQLEYRVTFLTYVVAIFLYYSAQLGVVLVIVHKFHVIRTPTMSWGMGDMAFLYGLLILSQGLGTLLLSSFNQFDAMIADGKLDRLLLRPLSPLLQIVCMEFDLSSVAHFFFGVATFVVATQLADIHWTLGRVLYLIPVVAGGFLILAAIRIAVSSVAFWSIRNQSLVHLLVYSAKEFLLYPVSIYRAGIQIFLTLVFPIAFVNFYPAQYFLGKGGDGLFHPVVQFLTPLVGLVLFVGALRLWHYGLRFYQSAGN